MSSVRGWKGGRGSICLHLVNQVMAWTCVHATHLRWCVCAATPGPLLWAPQSAACGPVVTAHKGLSPLPNVIAINDLQGINACKQGSHEQRSH